MALLLTPNPYLAYARVARAFHPEPAAKPGVHPMAWVDPTARLGSDVTVAAGAFIGARAQIGARCRIGPNAVVGDAVVLGEDTVVGPNASLSHCEIGARVLIYPGARIGQDGFGFAAGPKGLVKVPQLGRVIIGDGCEIGANSCIDRGSASDTIIGPGTVIDNLVQIGHNVKIGRNCILVSQVGISGSTQLGDGVIIGGQGGLVGHLRIGSGAQIAAQSGVMRDIAPGEVVGGSPAVPIAEWRRQSAMLRRLIRRKGD
jgi:UDP-3-O-[3-hydroxymyristoyl] glucosamine N-acyltransferase